MWCQNVMQISISGHLFNVCLIACLFSFSGPHSIIRISPHRFGTSGLFPSNIPRPRGVFPLVTYLFGYTLRETRTRLIMQILISEARFWHEHGEISWCEHDGSDQFMHITYFFDSLRDQYEFLLKKQMIHYLLKYFHDYVFLC